MYPNHPTPATREAERQMLACLLDEYTGEIEVLGYCIQRPAKQQKGVWQKANEASKAKAAK